MLSKKNLGLRGLMKLKPKGVSKVQSNKEVPTAKTDAIETVLDSKNDDKSSINDKIHIEATIGTKSNNIQPENTLTESKDVNVSNAPCLPITCEDTSIDTVSSVPLASHVYPPKDAPVPSIKNTTVITKSSKSNKDKTISSKEDTLSLNKSLTDASEKNDVPVGHKKDSEKENSLIKLPTSKPNLEHSVYKKRKSNYQSKMNAGDLNKDTMSVFDLIFYNPEGKPMSNRHKYENSRKRQRRNTNNDADREESIVDTPDDVSVSEADKNDSGDTAEKVDNEVADDDAKSDPEVEDDELAVQVKLNPNGNIIIDQESLEIKQTVDEERVKAIKSNAVVDEYTQRVFTKKRKRAQDWTINETAHFYKALSTVGTDFSLMKELFFKKSPRDRAELKVKFKKEEKLNRALIDSALGDSFQYDLTTFEHQTEFDAEADRANVKQALKEDMKKRKEMQRLAEQKERMLEKEQKKLRKLEEKQRRNLLRKSNKPKPFKVGRPRKLTAVLEEEVSGEKVTIPDNEDNGMSELKTPARRSSRPHKKREIENFEFLDDGCEASDNSEVDADYQDSVLHDSQLTSTAVKKIPKRVQKRAADDSFTEAENQENTTVLSYDGGMELPSSANITEIINNPDGCLTSINLHEISLGSETAESPSSTVEKSKKLQNSFSQKKSTDKLSPSTPKRKRKRVNVVSSSESEEEEEENNLENNEHIKVVENSGQTIKLELINFKMNAVTGELSNNLENGDGNQSDASEMISGDESINIKTSSQSNSQANPVHKLTPSNETISDSKDIPHNCYEQKPYADSNNGIISSIHEDVGMVDVNTEENTELNCLDDLESHNDSKTEDKVCEPQNDNKIRSETEQNMVMSNLLEKDTNSETNIECNPEIYQHNASAMANSYCKKELKGENNKNGDISKEALQVKSLETASSEGNSEHISTSDETSAKVLPKSSMGFKGRLLKRLKPMTKCTIKKSTLLKSNVLSKEEGLKPISVLDSIQQSNSENNKISSSEDVFQTSFIDKKLTPKLEYQKDEPEKEKIVDKQMKPQDDNCLQEDLSGQVNCKPTVKNSLSSNQSEANSVNESKNIKSAAVKSIGPLHKATKSGLSLRNFKKIRPTSKKTNGSVPISDSSKVCALPPKIEDEIKIRCNESNNRNVDPCINRKIESSKVETSEVSEYSPSHSSPKNVQIQSEYTSNLKNAVGTNRLQTSLQNDVVIVSEVEPASSSIRSDIDVIHCTIPPKTKEKVTEESSVASDNRDVNLIDLTSEIHQKRVVTTNDVQVVHSVGMNISCGHDSTTTVMPNTSMDLRESPAMANRFPTVQTSAVPLYAPCQSSFGTNPSPSMMHSINERFAPFYQQPLMTSHITSPCVLDRSRPHSAFSLPTPRTFLQTPPLNNSFCSAEPQITAIIDSRPASAGPQNLSKNITKRFNFALSDILKDSDGKQIVRVPRSNNLFVNIPVPTLPTHARGVTVLKSPVIKDGRKAWTYNLYPL